MKTQLLPVKFVGLVTGLILLVSILTAAAQDSSKPWDPNVSPLPAPTGFINDYAGVIEQGTKDRLEKQLKDLRDQTNPSVEIAVAIVKTTGDRPIFDYSLAVARGWKIGSKADDNPSALLFVAIDDRKYFTQVSRDLEDELPDGVVGSLQRQYLVPAFKQGNYSKGIEDTIGAYIQTIANKGNAPVAKPTPAPTNAGRGIAAGGGISIGSCCFLIFIIIVVLIIITGSRRGGGGGGGFMSSVLPWLAINAVSGAMRGGSSSSWGGDSGSSWSGGGSSDWGGGGGGGFGGFGGGGDFGGGGSGGDW